MLLNKYTMDQKNSSSGDYYFIITAGPTGTGKSSLVDKTLEYLGISASNKDKKYVLIDDIVTRHQKYKDGIDSIIGEVYSECKEDETCEDNKYDTAEFISRFKNNYDNTRYGITPCNNETKKNCDTYNDELLAKYLRDEEKINRNSR